MSSRFRPLALVAAAAVVAWLVSSGAAHQPPAPQKGPPGDKIFEPAFTAFPELKVPLKKAPFGDGMVPDGDKIYGRLLKGHPRPIPADAPPLRKVKITQLNEGADFVLRQTQVIAIGKWTMPDYLLVLQVTPGVYRLGAELADDPTEKVGWYEDLVIFLKAGEWTVRSFVAAGVAPSQALHLSRFHRLQAETELLELKAAIDKAGRR